MDGQNSMARWIVAGMARPTYPLVFRRAAEKLISLTKESVMASQGVLGQEEIDRLNIIRDCIVAMVEDMERE